MKADEVEFVAEVARAGAGLSVERDKLYVIESRLAPVARREGFGSIRDLLLAARHRREGKLMWAVVEAMAGGETSFFRDPAIFARFRDEMLPELARRRGRAPVRVWSAGCSTGEEPYTLAMFLLEEKDKLLAGWTFDILATDLNDNSLEAARAGIYGEYALRNTSDVLRRKYFKDAGDKKLQANDLLKAPIRFDRINLSDDSKMLFQKGIDVIFCCNVLIYFDLASKRRVVQHFYSNLLPGGYLFMGHAESLFQVNESFRLVHFLGTTAYSKPTALQAAGAKK